MHGLRKIGQIERLREAPPVQVFRDAPCVHTGSHICSFLIPLLFNRNRKQEPQDSTFAQVFSSTLLSAHAVHQQTDFHICAPTNASSLNNNSSLAFFYSVWVQVNFHPAIFKPISVANPCENRYISQYMSLPLQTAHQTSLKNGQYSCFALVLAKILIKSCK